MTGLDGKVAIVTGAAQGIGAAYAAALAQAGAAVVVADVLDGAAVAERIGAAGGRAIALAADVAERASCEAMVARTLEAFGRLDILVNNAALFGTLERKPFLAIGNDEWDRVMDVNVRGPFLCTRAAVPAMRRAGYGKIVHVASSTVFKGIPNTLHYVASKGAVVAMTRAMARELGEHGIRVNAIAPGLTMSDNLVARADQIRPFAEVANRNRAIKRDQMPDDLVGTLLFLASPASDFMTGQTLVVDGGEVPR